MALNIKSRLELHNMNNYNNVSFLRNVILRDILTGRHVLMLNKIPLYFILKTLSKDIESYNKKLHISKDGGGVLSYFILYNSQNNKLLNQLMDKM